MTGDSPGSDGWRGEAGKFRAYFTPGLVAQQLLGNPLWTGWSQQHLLSHQG